MMTRKARDLTVRRRDELTRDRGSRVLSQAIDARRHLSARPVDGPGARLICSVRATPATRTSRKRTTSKGLPRRIQRTREHKMPRVEVLSEVQGADHEVMLSEHAPSGMFADEYHAEQLVERLGWAFPDAERHGRHERQSTPVTF